RVKPSLPAYWKKTPRSGLWPPARHWCGRTGNWRSSVAEPEIQRSRPWPDLRSGSQALARPACGFMITSERGLHRKSASHIIEATDGDQAGYTARSTASAMSLVGL